MKTTVQLVFMYAFVYGMIAVLLTSLTADASIVKRSFGVEDCQYECNSDVYKCDIRCKYLDFLKGNNLKRCHGACADRFLDCFLGCYYMGKK